MTTITEVQKELGVDEHTARSFSDLPPGKNAFAVMSGVGDLKTIWDPNIPAEVEAAREQFYSLTAMGYLAYRVSAEDPNKQGLKMTEFDPLAGRIILHKQLQGG